MTLPGTDVSAFQGPPPWQNAAGAIEWAAVKISELQPGSIPYLDPDAPSDWNWLRAHGKVRIGYLYGHPSVSVSATVALFGAELARIGLDDADGLMLDLETTDGLSAAAVDAWALDVLRLIERDLGRKPLLYTFLSFAEAGNCASLGGYPLWISDPSRPPGQPRVPGPWATWRIHQYNITGIDRDVAAFPSLAAMAEAVGRPAPVHLSPAPVTIPGDPMLLSKGAGALTPVAIPDTAKSLRFLAADTAQVTVLFHGQPAAQVLSLSWAAGSHSLTPPASVWSALVTRTDAGTGDVCVVAQ